MPLHLWKDCWDSWHSWPGHCSFLFFSESYVVALVKFLYFLFIFCYYSWVREIVSIVLRIVLLQCRTECGILMTSNPTTGFKRNKNVWSILSAMNLALRDVLDHLLGYFLVELGYTIQLTGNICELWYIEVEEIDTLNKLCALCSLCVKQHVTERWDSTQVPADELLCALIPCSFDTRSYGAFGFLSLCFLLQLALQWASGKQRKGSELFVRTFPCPLPRLRAALM